MFRCLRLAIAFFIAGGTGISQAQPWVREGFSSDLIAECNSVADTPLPPAIAQATASEKCSSADLYYGINQSPDYKAALACAERERVATDERWPDIKGAAVLTMLAANGLGMPRNLPLALRFSCESGGAEMEVQGRLDALKHLQANNGSVVFNFCDYSTSGLEQGSCEEIKNEVEEAERRLRLDRIAANLPIAQRSLFAKLRKAADEYANQVMSNEVDQSGTGRFARTVGALSDEQQMFENNLHRLMNGTLPAVSVLDLEMVDPALNKVYNRTRERLKKSDMSTQIEIVEEGVKQTEHAWIIYRDAFSAYAAVIAPDSRIALEVELTKQRTESLKSILELTQDN